MMEFGFPFLTPVRAESPRNDTAETSHQPKMGFHERLLVMQGHQRINTRCLTRRYECRERRDADHQGDCDHDCESVIGRQAEQNTFDIASRSQRAADAESNAKDDEKYAFAHHETQ